MSRNTGKDPKEHPGERFDELTHLRTAHAVSKDGGGAA